MNAREFVTKYGIAGGADEMRTTVTGKITYKCVFRRAGSGNSLFLNMNVGGDSSHTATPFTPTSFVLVLLAQVTKDERFVPIAPRGLESHYELNYTDSDIELLKRWMGSEAMWADFLSITSP